MERERRLDLVADAALPRLTSMALLALLVSFILFSSCIDLKPRENLPDRVNISVQVGSGACTGGTESYCGAFVKQKRIMSGALRCQGVNGPVDAQATDSDGVVLQSTYDLSKAGGWECVGLPQGTSLTKSLGPQTLSVRTELMGTSYLYNGAFTASISDANLGLLSVGSRCSISFGCGTHVAFNAYCGAFPRSDNTNRIVHMISNGVPFSWTSLHSCPGGSPVVYPLPSCQGPISFPSFAPTSTENVLFLEMSSDQQEVSFTVTCNIDATYNVSWYCSNRRNYPVAEYKFYACADEPSSTVGTFQGGFSFLNFKIPRDELSDMISGYYVTGKRGMKQIPMFMIGQGPTFNDFEYAKTRCNLITENVVNVSMGNLVFDPAKLTVGRGTGVCWKNMDDRNHSIIVSGSNPINVSVGDTECVQPREGLYPVVDSPTGYDRGTLEVKPTSETIYVAGRITPEYFAVQSGSIIRFTANDMNKHSMILRLTDFPTGSSQTVPFTLNPSGGMTTFPYLTTSHIPGLLGEQEIEDNSTKQLASLFLYSPDYTFTFTGTGANDVTPSKFIARPLGDSNGICFTSSYAGLSINVSISTEEGWKIVYDQKPLDPSSLCCYTPATGGLYKATVSDGREVQFLISRQAPTATIYIQHIGFEPESATTTPTARLCLSNPAPETRSVDVHGIMQKGAGSGAYTVQYSKSLTIGAFQQSCEPVFSDPGVVSMRFSDLDVPDSGIVTLTSEKTTVLKITSYGFDPPVMQVKPNDKVCISNADASNHTLRASMSTSSLPITQVQLQSGNFVPVMPSVLMPNETVCFTIRSGDANNYFAIRHDKTNAIGFIDVFNEGEYGVILTPFGASPSRMNAPVSTKEIIITSPVFHHVPASSSTVKIINRVGKAVNITTEQDLTLNENSLSLVSVSSIAPLRLRIYNKDRSDHTLNISGTLFVSKPGWVNISEFTSGHYTLRDETLFSKKSNSYTVSVDVGAVAYVNQLNDGAMASFKSSESPGVFSFKESGRNTTADIIFSSPPEEFSQVPLMNETMDLPVQYVTSYVPPEVLSMMREYTDRGLIPAIVPNFRNLEVKIKYSSFTPESTVVTAGSTVRLANNDTIAHNLNITKSNLSFRCDSRNASRYNCRLEPSRNVCQAGIKSPSSEVCNKFESDFSCSQNTTTLNTQALRNAVTCSKNISTSFCTYSYANPPGQNSLLCQATGTFKSGGTCTANPSFNGFICSWQSSGSNSYCWVSVRTENADTFTYKYCTRSSTQACEVRQDYDLFGQEYVCNLAGPSCQLQTRTGQDGWINDFSESYCIRNSTSSNSSVNFTLAPRGTYLFNTTRDSSYILNDTSFGNIGTVNVTNLDVDATVGFTQLFPDLAQMAPWQRVELINYLQQALTVTYSELTSIGTSSSGSVTVKNMTYQHPLQG